VVTKILIIRRDNIGDLVCTTPLLRALRAHYPDAYIAALVNSYNRAVVENNPDINALFFYTKLKHRVQGRGIVHAYLEHLRLLLMLRRMRFDYVILAGTGFLPRVLRIARFINPRHIIGFTEPGQRNPSGLALGIPYTLPHPLHETEDVFRLLEPLGVYGAPPAACVYPDATEAPHARARLRGGDARLLIGVHISARKPSQRWPAVRFIEFITQAHALYDARFVLFWSPGDAQNRLHPGDDVKAHEIISALQDITVSAYPTEQLPKLIAGLSVCDAVVCSDGGAMHIAAGLGKPILCFFGKSDTTRWRPWGVTHVVLQPESLNVEDVTVDEALDGLRRLFHLCEQNGVTVTPAASHIS